MNEINKRADKFAELGIADIEQYNQVYGNKLPRIFEVFDEISCYKVDGSEEDEVQVYQQRSMNNKERIILGINHDTNVLHHHRGNTTAQGYVAD